MIIGSKEINELLDDVRSNNWQQQEVNDNKKLEQLISNTHNLRNGQYKSDELSGYFATKKQSLSPEQFARFRGITLLKTMQSNLAGKTVRLPAPLRAELEKNRARMLSWSQQPSVWDQYVDDVYWKDLAIAGGALTPLRGGVLHISAGLGLRQALSKDIMSLLKYLILLAVNGRKPYFEIHTHLPLVEDFNQKNWLLNYRDIANLMSQNPSIKGVFRASWFLDPKLEAISPNLSYLSSFPISGGASLFSVGPDDSNSAFARSKTRKAFFQSGNYVPHIYLLVWSRKKLLHYFKHIYQD